MIHFQHSYFIVLTMKKILISFFCIFLFIGWVFADNPSMGPYGDKPVESCSTSEGTGSFCSPKFEINVSTFSPGWNKFVWKWISSFFTTLIENLMIGLWVIALLIMTVGAGYMIFYHGQDEYLSKGKSIFMAGIISLIVALSSYWLVSLLRFILY